MRTVYRGRPRRTEVRRVVIVGGGIAGLAIAAELRRRSPSASVAVLEASPRPGGSIRSTKEFGFLYEWGPTGFLDNAPDTLDLARQAGLGHRLLPANAEAARRFVVRGRRLRELPHGPLGFFASSLLSPGGRLRVLREPFIAAKRDGADESVLSFATRRIGKEAAEVLVDAMVTGIWAGDSRRLSVVSAFPKLVALEREHGSLVRGMLARRKGSGGPTGPSGTLTSFPNGLEELPTAIAASLGEALKLSTRVTGLDHATGAWRVAIEPGGVIEADDVVVAIPSNLAASLLAGLDRALSDRLAAIPSAPVAVVHLGFAGTDAGDNLPGFGALAPRGETESLLGVLVPSNIFPDRAPVGSLLATAMLGGARDPAIVEKDDDAIVAKALAEIGAISGLKSQPRFVRVIRHMRAIPQYNLGHAERLAAIDADLRRQPGLHLAGNSYRGIAINACIADARVVAGALEQ